ncbi:hypothetical protein AVEN_104237-1 [Araneus ventricosus]|uniref:Histone-lysine N-methyltransferase SETMAR n=1 Tax=Araneus ventricosus TaxID=182803 RepID=A0A4Y2X8P7_ARAVE|nr:hypothetical protein AVEN_104237-1 [Araneus ventricosus]
MRCTQQLLERFRWEGIDHPTYSPDLAPSDYHLLQYLKRSLGKQHLPSWLRSSAANLFDIGVDKLVSLATIRTVLMLRVDADVTKNVDATGESSLCSLVHRDKV